MKHTFHIAGLICLMAFAVSFQTAQAKSKKTKGLYAFNYASCLTDTTAYTTTVVWLEGAELGKKGKFFSDAPELSEKFRQYMQKTYKKPFFATTFYEKKREKLEKKLVKIRRRFKKDNPGRPFQILPAEDFIPVMPEPEPELPTETDASH
ncbi:MAG: hypothetical protein ACI3YC_01785 [Alloprevotella sp.]